jgi:hypothetical protein
MIVDAYQHILRNVELKAKKPAKTAPVSAENAPSGWFAQYAPALDGFWTAKSAK